MSREEAVSQLVALGVTINTRPHDVRALHLAIRRHKRRQKVFMPIRQCVGKMQHASPDAARKMARISGDPFMECYHCPTCGSWHNGHAPKGRGR